MSKNGKGRDLFRPFFYAFSSLDSASAVDVSFAIRPMYPIIIVSTQFQ